MRDRVVWLLAVAVVGYGVDCLECPNHCFCYMWEDLVKTDCVRRNLINTFLGISHRTQILDLSHNVISILHGNEFSDANLRRLRYLSLSNNQLHKIDKFSFNGLHLLTTLDLSFNSIEYLNPSTFMSNPDLQILNVSFNPLTVHEPFLSPAPSLKILDLANCRFDFVSPRTFSDLVSLSVLNISRNHIREVQFSEGMKNLRYLDISQNDIPCNEQTNAILQFFLKRKIHVQGFCQTSQKMQMLPQLETEEGNRLEVGSYQGDHENMTQVVQQHRSILNDIATFLQSIPSFYAIVCGMQLGIFIGSFSTYICLKKSKRGVVDMETTAEMGGFRRGESHNLPSDLIPLNTPPGTPPSPYHSRFFPSSFSLSAT